jgi:arabinogalactan oligomer / maltooligosaccharide transport system substrate-binding protein
MRSIRRHAAGVFAIVASFALIAAACSSGNDNATTSSAPPAATSAPPPSTSPAPQFTSGSLLIWADETRAPVLQPIADTFMANNPGVTVEIQNVDFGQIRDQLLQAGPAGEGPDIIIGAHDWLGQLVTGGAVAPISLPNPGDFLPVAIQAFTYNGQLYGVPYAVENIALIRNTDLVPDAPATFEDLEATALSLKDAGTVDVALAMQVPDPYHQEPLFTAEGGYVFGKNADGTYNPDDLGLDSPGGLEAADKFDQWVSEGLIDKDVTYDVMIDKFGSGKAPFAITGPWAVAQADTGFKATGVNYVVEPIPPIDGGTARPFVGVQGFMISQYSKNPLIAQAFVVQEMTTEETQLALFQAGGRPPALQSAYDQAASDPDIQGFGASGQNGDPLPAIPEMSSVWTAWTDAYTQIFAGGSNAEDVFKNAASQIRTLIAGG